MPIPVAIGEDSLIVREGVRQLLAVDPEVEIVAAVADQVSLRQACGDEHPDVVLTDVRMPPTHTDEGVRLAPHFAALPGLRSKVWLADAASGTYGGVYTWADRPRCRPTSTATCTAPCATTRRSPVCALATSACSPSPRAPRPSPTFRDWRNPQRGTNRK